MVSYLPEVLAGVIIKLQVEYEIVFNLYYLNPFAM